jgi:hypothetical protein
MLLTDFERTLDESEPVLAALLRRYGIVTGGFPVPIADFADDFPTVFDDLAVFFVIP